MITNTKRNKIRNNTYSSIIFLGLVSIILMGSIENRNNFNSVNLPTSAADIPTFKPGSEIKFFDLDDNLITSKVTIGDTIIIQIMATPDCAEAKFYFQSEFKRYTTQPEQMYKFGSELYRYQLNTSNFKNQKLDLGEYKFEFILSNSEEESNDQGADGYTFENFITIVDQQDSSLIIILIGVVVGVIVIAGVFLIIRKKSGRDEYDGAPVGTTKRREIYSGASQIGKMSGKQAESRLAARKGKTVTSRSTSRETNRRSVSKPIKTKSSDFDNMKKLPASLQMKMEESKVGMDKRTNFLISKVDSLNSQLDLLKVIISVRPEDTKCPICNKVIGLEWEFCPYCKIQNQDAELGMQISMNTMGSNQKICDKCGLELKASWNQCPNCLIKSRT